MARPLRIAIAGAGYFSAFHHDAWARIPAVTVVANCDADLTKARAAASRHNIARSFGDVAAMLNEMQPDLVDIVTPPQTHAALCRLVADRGIAAVCQKAFCTSLAEARETAAYVQRRGCLLVVHENFRFQPWYRKARDLIAIDGLGEIYQITFRLRPGDGQGPDAYLERQPYFRKMPRFLVHETAIHLVDTFRFLLGEVTGVMARLRTLNPAIAGEDAGFILFDFASGARGLFDGNRLCDHKARNRRLTMGEMSIEGSGGTLSLDGDGVLRLRAFGGNEDAPVGYAWEDRGFGGDCVHALCRHVVDHIVDGAAIENDANAYVRNLEIEDAIYRSNALRQYVDLSGGTGEADQSC